ncbi:MAG TPA: CocE/NonD family hydrolase, partial [Vicinamibacterales bacterium]|nr:CocE/NonD family hydrolase [Vicinamibacterales bacterium]
MTLASRVLARVYRLSPALTHDIEVERGIPVTMPDGVVLLADRLAARGRTDLPTILIRTPYGRRSLTSWMIGTRLLAERGFNVVVQSCRGTDGSGGVLDPFRTEKEDGLATVAWLRRQSWYSGRFATYGPSYLGIVQWAIAQDAGTELKAIAPLIAPSNMGAFITQGGGFQLEVMLWWTCVMRNGHARFPSSLHRVGAWLSQLKGLALQRNELAAFDRFLPVSGLDVATTGSTVQWWQDWTGHSAADEWWSRMDFRSGIGKVGAPAYMVAGWDD